MTVIKSHSPLAAIPGLLFHGVSFDAKDRSTRSFSLAGLDAELEDERVFSWVDIQAPDISPMNEVLRRMELDLTLISHFDQPEVLPRIVERPDCLAFYLYPIYEPEGHLDTRRGISDIEFARLIVVLGVDYIITYHQRPLDAVEEIKATCEESFRLAGKTPGFIAFLFLQRCLYDYAHLNLANDNYLDGLQADLTAGGSEAVQGAIGVASRNILTLKKLASSLHIVLMLLGTKRNRFVSEEAPRLFPGDAAKRPGHPGGGRLVPGPPRRPLGQHPGRSGEAHERDCARAYHRVQHHAASDPHRWRLRHELREHAGAQVGLWILRGARSDGRHGDRARLSRPAKVLTP